jgi:hypothetical protein
MDIKFTANAICAAERVIGKPFGAIIGELESEDGASLSTVRALLAAGRVGARYADMSTIRLDHFVAFEEAAAGTMIDAEGVDAVAAALGTALREYFAPAVAANG